MTPKPKKKKEKRKKKVKKFMRDKALSKSYIFLLNYKIDSRVSWNLILILKVKTLVFIGP